MNHRSRTDVQKIASLIREYWERKQNSKWYHEQLATLAQDIGVERVERAREDYELSRVAVHEAAEEDHDRR